MDGTVVFHAETSLLASDTNAFEDIYLRDGSELILVTKASNGAPSKNASLSDARLEAREQKATLWPSAEMHARGQRWGRGFGERFRVERVIEKSGPLTTYEGWDLQTGRPVVLKVAPGLARERQLRLAYEAELLWRCAREVDHIHVRQPRVLAGLANRLSFPNHNQPLGLRQSFDAGQPSRIKTFRSIKKVFNVSPGSPV